ncbi:hypothetical protein [Marivita geojedonensis]|uniref:hypothetical protein n=1 Tax=Marivita geojedonensis TaxID=1123756 RepID=UPI000A1E1E73|nr:hypothetical protein [Marivita geojedonensis]PRY73873.1 hypothetical protein CLV76_12752 [Marivita geojedonensis]
MKFPSSAQRMLRNPFRIVSASVVCFTLVGGALQAQSAAFVVGNDRGGIVGDRAAEIRRLKSAGRRVEIRGRICLSSCTMYLGAGDVCVDPETRFGFHGPSYYGQPLAPQHFEYWSEVIADHYPKPLKDWFMSTARYRMNGYHTIKGAELIRLGTPEC